MPVQKMRKRHILANFRSFLGLKWNLDIFSGYKDTYVDYFLVKYTVKNE